MQTTQNTTQRDAEYLSLREAANLMRMHPATVRRMIGDGLLVASNPTGGKIIVARVDIDALTAKTTTRGNQPSQQA